MAESSPQTAPESAPARRDSTAGMNRWRRRSRLIHTLRWVLPVLIAAIAAGLLGWMGWNAYQQRAKPNAKTPAEIKLVGARFVGRLDDGRSFSIGAGEATRDPSDLGQVVLANPTMTVGADSERPMRLSAKAGTYNEKTRQLALRGDVRVDDGLGNRFSTNEAIADTKTGEVSGQNGVTTDGPLGRITSESYAVHDKGDRVVFQGRVKARIERTK